MGKFTHVKKHASKKLKFHHGNRKLASYINGQAAELPDLIIGPCYDEDRVSTVGSSNPSDEDVETFLSNCPRLNRCDALILLTENDLETSIKVGKTITATAKEDAKTEMRVVLGDPLDLDFEKNFERKSQVVYEDDAKKDEEEKVPIIKKGRKPCPKVSVNSGKTKVEKMGGKKQIKRDVSETKKEEKENQKSMTKSGKKAEKKSKSGRLETLKD